MLLDEWEICSEEEVLGKGLVMSCHTYRKCLMSGKYLKYHATDWIVYENIIV